MWVDLGIFFKYLTLWKDALLRTAAAAAEIEENRADRRSLANLLVSWPKLGNCEIDSTLFFILAQSKHSIKRPLGTCSQNYPDDERCDDKIISFLFFSKPNYYDNYTELLEIIPRVSFFNFQYQCKKYYWNETLLVILKTLCNNLMRYTNCSVVLLLATFQVAIFLVTLACQECSGMKCVTFRINTAEATR